MLNQNEKEKLIKDAVNIFVVLAGCLTLAIALLHITDYIKKWH
jgi:hypothetical protein